MKELADALQQKLNSKHETPFDYATLGQSVAEAINATTQERTVIGISGQGASGKSFLAKLLRENIAEHTDILCTDDFLYAPGSIQQDRHHSTEEQGRLTACDVRRTDLAALKKALTTFRHAQKITVPDYLGYAKSDLTDNPRHLIVEGIGASFLDIADFDVSIFLDISEAEELRRRCARNNHTVDEIMANGFAIRRTQYESNVLPLSRAFDFVFASGKDYLLHRK